MKKVKKSAMDSKSKAYSAPQRRQMVPSATSHLARSSSSAITLRPKASQTMHVKSGTDVGTVVLRYFYLWFEVTLTLLLTSAVLF